MPSAGSPPAEEPNERVSTKPRPIQIAQKVSGGFRSNDGAKAFLAFRSYLSTAAKQGVNRLEALRQLFNGEAWMPAAPGAGP